MRKRSSPRIWPGDAFCADLAAVPGVSVVCRPISEGDEQALMPEERDAFARSVIERRRASGAARIIARELLAQLGFSPLTALPKSQSGAPTWPNGIVGSLAHDPLTAIAAIGKRSDVAALGIDIEPKEAVPFELDLIASARERRRIGCDPIMGRLLFTAKEAVYKALNPLDNVFLEFSDIEINFDNRVASVRGGRIVDLRFCTRGSLITLAFLRFKV